MPRMDAGEAVVGQPVRLGVERMDLQKRLWLVGAELRALAAPGHAVPLVAEAAGVEPQRIFGAGLLAQRGRLRRDETGLAIRRAEAAVCEQPRRVRRLLPHRPLYRLQRVVVLVRDRGEPTEI